MNVIYLLLVAALSGCSTSGHVVESRENYLEISIATELVHPVCEGENIDPENVLVGVYAELDGVLYDFFFRSPQDKETCHETKTKIQDILQSSKRINIVGIHPDTVSDIDFKKHSKQHPKKLGTFTREVSAVFIRMNSDNGCVSFFIDDCSPMDKWGGIIPGKSKYY